MTKEEIGSILKRLRIENGLTQKEVASKIGRTQQIIGHWETGYAQPDANTLFTLLCINERHGAMIIYRPHRGGLKEAMELRKVFKTEAEMFEYISTQTDGAVSVEDLSIGEILGDDPRIGWKDCRYVLTSRYRSEHFAVPQVIGTCSYQWAND